MARKNNVRVLEAPINKDANDAVETEVTGEISAPPVVNAATEPIAVATPIEATATAVETVLEETRESHIDKIVDSVAKSDFDKRYVRGRIEKLKADDIEAFLDEFASTDGKRTTMRKHLEAAVTFAAMEN